MPNVPDQRPGATDLPLSTTALSPGSLHLACWATSSEQPIQCSGDREKSECQSDGCANLPPRQPRRGKETLLKSHVPQVSLRAKRKIVYASGSKACRKHKRQEGDGCRSNALANDSQADGNSEHEQTIRSRSTFAESSDRGIHKRIKSPNSISEPRN